MLTPLFEVEMNPDKRLLSLTYLKGVEKEDMVGYMVAKYDKKNISDTYRVILSSEIIVFNSIPLGTRSDGIVMLMYNDGRIGSMSSSWGNDK